VYSRRIVDIRPFYMPSVLIALTGILVGADTGLQMRRAGHPLMATTAASYFPVLSVTAALLTGIALAEVALLALLEHWPELARYIAGPLLAVFGFIWFQGAVLEQRLRPARADSSPVAEERLMPAERSPLRVQIVLGMRMGLVLCAAGVRTVPTLTASIIAAIVLATAAPPTLQAFSSPRVPLPIVVRTATGALLCAIGVGTEVERLTQGAVPTLQVALPLVLLVWGTCAITFWRSPRH
jgi:hypothetical protein